MATGRDPQTLLWIAGDLRRIAEAHIKSGSVEEKRIERKRLASIANALLERAQTYEAIAAGRSTTW